MLVWASNCQARQANAAADSVLRAMDSGFSTSIDPFCPDAGGESFWLARLSPEQAEIVRKQTTAVKSVVPDLKYDLDHLRPASATTMRTKVPAQRKSSRRAGKPRPEKVMRSEKRSSQIVVEQNTDDLSLAFLSTSKGKINGFTYAYLEQAGEGSLVYLLDTGVNAEDNEFGSKALQFIYAAGASREPTDAPGGSGTCIGTKIAGALYGVAKEVEMIVVKVSPTAGSFIDGLGLVLTDLQQRAKRGFFRVGRIVVSTRGGWVANSDPELDYNVGIIWQEMQKRISSLAQDFQVVFVASAGRDAQSDYPDIHLWPAALAPDIPIIVAGAVMATDQNYNGQRFPWSHGGEKLTVSAPGNGQCKDNMNHMQHVEGYGLAAAITSGLAAYFLSLPDLADYWRLHQGNIPRTMINYLQKTSYRRYGAEKSLWNGMDAYSTKHVYDHWTGAATGGVSLFSVVFVFNSIIIS